MATASVSGLVSGLDTATIISQLMQVEGQTRTRLSNQVTAEQSTVKSLQDLNSKLATLATTAETLMKAGSWNPVTITSSSDKVTATGTAATTTGQVSLTVGRTATAHSLSFTGTSRMTDVVTTGSTKVRLDALDGSTPREIDSGDGTLTGLIKGLNAAGTGVRASTVLLDDGSYRLRVTSTTTGAASDFALSNLDGSALLGGPEVTAGADAEITVGSDVLHSATNTFAGVVNGLDITLRNGVAAGTQVDLSVTQDTKSLTTSVKGLVDAVNGILTSIDSLTSYNATAKSSGALSGDASVRSLRNSLLETVYPPGGGSLASVGIQTDRYGKLVFNEDAFTKALAADPAAVAAAFTVPTTGSASGDGFAARVRAVAKGASDSVSGSVTQSIKGRNDGIRRMQNSIADWDTRLALRQETLTRQFTALETTLSQMNSQSSWLSGQLASLSSG